MSDVYAKGLDLYGTFIRFSNISSISKLDECDVYRIKMNNKDIFTVSNKDLNRDQLIIFINSQMSN